MQISITNIYIIICYYCYIITISIIILLLFNINHIALYIATFKSLLLCKSHSYLSLLSSEVFFSLSFHYWQYLCYSYSYHYYYYYH